MNHRYNLIAVFALCSSLVISLPLGGADDGAYGNLEDPKDGIVDLLLDCTNRTVGDYVGYQVQLNTIHTSGLLHVVRHETPYNAYGVFDYLGVEDEVYWYQILGGYSFDADDCSGGLNDLFPVPAED